MPVLRCTDLPHAKLLIRTPFGCLRTAIPVL